MNSNAIESSTVSPVSRYLAGSRYDETVDLSLDVVAELIHADIVGVQRDEMISPQARFVVAADTAGPVRLIHVTISGLDTPPDVSSLFYDRGRLTRNTVTTVVALASKYNRVERARLDRARFLVAVDAIGTDGQRYSGYLATMVWTAGDE
jgi:hypothetical protein